MMQEVSLKVATSGKELSLDWGKEGVGDTENLRYSHLWPTLSFTSQCGVLLMFQSSLISSAASLLSLARESSG